MKRRFAAAADADHGCRPETFVEFNRGLVFRPAFPIGYSVVDDPKSPRRWHDESAIFCPMPRMPTPRPNRTPGTHGQNCCRNPCRRRLHLAIPLILACAILPVGCASWSSWPGHEDPRHSDRGGATLPLKKITRTIELETRFVQIRFDPADPDQLQSMWQWVDETVLSPETRTVLRHNGLRIGKAAQPERLVGKLDALQSAQTPDIVADFLSSVAVSSHQSEGTKTIPMRLGKRYELPVRLPIQGDQVVIIHDHPQPIGRTLRDPQFLLAVTPRPDRVASQIRLRVRPEIQHGDMQQDWVQGDAALRIDVRRQSWSLDSMEFELAGGEGDLFVVSETTERKGLGREMFGGKNVDQMEQQTVLLIRIANVPTPAEKL